MKRLKGPAGWAIFYAAFAAFDFTTAVLLDDAWLNYGFGALMVAALAFNLFQIKQRKAAPAVASSDLSRYMSGGYLSGGYASGGYASGGTFSRTYMHTTSTSPAFVSAADKAPGEFKGLPFDFAVGEVYGLRMWRMDQYGRLRARNWEKAPSWRPGVNEAKCVERGDDPYQAILHSFSSLSGRPTPPPKPAPKPPHDTPSEDCSCGFYAYTESHHAETLPYKDSHVVLGVIKGTGRTLMGTKGFRCEKAEIIAFRDPTRGGTKNDPWRVEQLANLKRVYPDVPILADRAALLEFAPLTNTLPDPSTDEFWNLP